MDKKRMLHLAGILTEDYDENIHDSALQSLAAQLVEMAYEDALSNNPDGAVSVDVVEEVFEDYLGDTISDIREFAKQHMQKVVR